MHTLQKWLEEAKTAAAPAEKVQERLKKKGFKRTQISVRDGGNSVRVTIKDLDIDKEKIERMFSKVEKVDYDANGEILSGGIYVFVEYDWKAVDAEEKRFAKEIKEVIKQGASHPGEWIPVGRNFKLSWHSKNDAVASPYTTYHLMYKNKLISRHDKNFVFELWRVFRLAAQGR